MRYFTFWQLCGAFGVFTLYGLIGGCIYPSAGRLLSALLRFVCLPVRAVKASLYRPRHSAEQGMRRGSAKGCVLHMTDFLFFLLFGVGFGLLSYVVLDGILRGFGVLCVLLAWLCAKHLLGRPVSVALDQVLLWVDRWLLFLLSHLCLPFVQAASILCRCLYRRLSPLCQAVWAAVGRHIRAKHTMRRRTKRSKSTKRICQSFDPLAKFMQSYKNEQNVSKILDKNIKK